MSFVDARFEHRTDETNKACDLCGQIVGKNKMRRHKQDNHESKLRAGEEN